jgi:hypothetical protein
MSYFLYFIMLMSSLAFSIIRFDFDDSYQINTHKASFDQIGRVDYFKDTKMMPVIEIRFISGASDRFDIFKTVKASSGFDWESNIDIDYQKLRKYFEISLVYYDKINDSNLKMNMQEFRNCRMSDFTERQFTT